MSNNKLSNEEVIKRSKERYGTNFSYEKTNYTGAQHPLIVTCAKHGDITTTYARHMKGYGCGECGKDVARRKRDKTAAEFVTKAKEILGDGYDFSLCVYGKDNKEKVKVICKEHGLFEMTPANIISGQKCPKCSRKNQADFHRMPEEEFKTRSSIKYGNKYDYSLVEYFNSQTKVKIICPVHGVFEQTPNQHLQVGGCNACAKEQSAKTKIQNRAATFVEDVVAVHGSTYELDQIEYIGLTKKITVGCKEHGYFSIRAADLIRGSGCKKCAKNGYRPNKPGTLYVLQSGDITKVGITNNLTEDRRRRVSKSSKVRFETLKEYHFEDGAIPDNIETAILCELRQAYKQPTEKFEGYRECFLNVNQVALLNRIEFLIKEQHSSYPASQEA